MIDRKSIFYVIIAGLMALFFCSCPTPSGSVPPATSPESSPTPIDTTEFEPQGGALVFQTNDGAYTGSTGSTVWRIGTLTEDPMTSFSARVVKDSGCARAGYGIVFAASGNRFLAVLIDTEGKYAIGSVTAGAWSYIDPMDPWKSAASLKKGYGLANVLTVTRIANPAQCEFQLSINGTDVETFIDGEGTLPAKGSFGFICVIGTRTDEDFPDRPVKVSFDELVPGDIGAGSSAARGLSSLAANPVDGKMECAIW
jgi:hypothetical protein